MKTSPFFKEVRLTRGLWHVPLESGLITVNKCNPKRDNHRPTHPPTQTHTYNAGKMTESNPIRTTATLLGITSTLVLSGINIGTSLLFVPHLPTLPIEDSTRIFAGLYHDGAKAVVPLAATSILSYAYLAATAPASRSWALAAGLVVSTLAWTRIVVMPVNKRLVDIARSGGGEARVGGGGRDGMSEVEGLLESWCWMNYVRGGVALAAGMVALRAVVV